MKQIAAALLVTVLLAGCSVPINTNGETTYTCSHANTYAETFPADGLKGLVVDAWAGDLSIRAVEGLNEVKVEAKACASDLELLRSLGVKARKSDDQLRVDVIHPRSFSHGAAWVDLAIEVPAGPAAQVSDTSGSTEINGLAAVQISAGSGDLAISDIAGRTEIAEKSSGRITLDRLNGDLILGEIGSGDLTVREVQGDVLLREKSSGSIQVESLAKSLNLGDLGSGDLAIRGVGGPITLKEKSSGRIQINLAQQGVRLGDLGSGDLTVADVTGDFSLGTKSSGPIRLTNLSGQVQLGDLGSGDLRVKQAGGHIVLESLGSGDLTVDGVQGDLIVKAKSSGSVHQSNVTGRVEIPDR